MPSTGSVSYTHLDVYKRQGPTATLLEWDDNIPSFAEVHAEALKANRYRTTPAQLEPEVLANLYPEPFDEVPA